MALVKNEELPNKILDETKKKAIAGLISQSQRPNVDPLIDEIQKDYVAIKKCYDEITRLEAAYKLAESTLRKNVEDDGDYKRICELIEDTKKSARLKKKK